MKKKTLIIYLLLSSSVFANDSEEFEKYMIRSQVENFCENKEYINCMSITKNKCKHAFQKSIHNCMKATDPKYNMPSPVCITDNYIKNTETAVDLAKKCDSIAVKILNKLKQQNMPNK